MSAKSEHDGAKSRKGSVHNKSKKSKGKSVEAGE
jgi:hypothetical protein